MNKSHRITTTVAFLVLLSVVFVLISDTSVFLPHGLSDAEVGLRLRRPATVSKESSKEPKNVLKSAEEDDSGSLHTRLGIAIGSAEAPHSSLHPLKSLDHGIELSWTRQQSNKPRGAPLQVNNKTAVSVEVLVDLNISTQEKIAASTSIATKAIVDGDTIGSANVSHSSIRRWKSLEQRPHRPTKALALANLSNYKDTSDVFNSSDIPIFWHVHKSGGSTVKNVMGGCYRFVMAAKNGILGGHDADQTLSVVHTRKERYVNVDTTTLEGIESAKARGFAGSGIADAVVTSYIYQANALFTSESQGRLFTVLRHPIDRAVSLFNYLAIADWEEAYRPELKNWTLERYATSRLVENDWMTRVLSGKEDGALSEQDLEVAKEVLRRKFLVGLMDEMAESMERFEKFFKWRYHIRPGHQEDCRQTFVVKGSNVNHRKRDKIEPGDVEWELLALNNKYDLQLYNYAVKLFEDQKSMFADIPDGFRHANATCCECSSPPFPPDGFQCPKPFFKPEEQKT